jgi:osmotically-inducible protein OsmY
MIKQGRYIALVILSLSLSSCMGSLWTGAAMIYDRHHFYKKWDDYHLNLKVSHALNVKKKDKSRASVIDIVVFNGDVLVVGHAPSVQVQEELRQRLALVQGYRRLFYQIEVSAVAADLLLDTWITGKIRSQILADSSIDPYAFKVVTSDQVVYLMGDVRREQAEKVVNIARKTSNVIHVVKIFKYFTWA